MTAPRAHSPTPTRAGGTASGSAPALRVNAQLVCLPPPLPRLADHPPQSALVPTHELLLAQRRRRLVVGQGAQAIA
jgi:hypothetical protein